MRSARPPRTQNFSKLFGPRPQVHSERRWLVAAVIAVDVLVAAAASYVIAIAIPRAVIVGMVVAAVVAVGKLASRRVGRLAGRQIGKSASLQVGRPASRRVAGRQVGQSEGRQVGTSQGGRPCSSDVWKLWPSIFQHAMFRRLARAASTGNAPRASLHRAHARARPAHAQTDALRANSTVSHPHVTIVDSPAVVVDRRCCRSIVVTVVDRRRRRSVLVVDKTPTETARFWNPRD